MVYFVGAGPGAVDLITVRGSRLLLEADIVIYAGSLVNPQLLRGTKADCQRYDSAGMTLEEVIAVMEQAEALGKMTVRLHTGDPSLYGAIREQMDCLEKRGIPYEVVPGVSSFCGAAAAARTEYTLPGVSQTLIISRIAGRTPVPDKEELAKLASHQASMVLFLSAGMLGQVRERLLTGGYPEDTPAALIYKATWPEEKTVFCTVDTLPETAELHGISKTALVLVGNFLGNGYRRSCLYDPRFSHGFRQAVLPEDGE